jgi:hypothetical protein
MSPQLIFWIFFLLLLFFVVYFDVKYNMLKDISTANKKPYSFSRVQLAWWSVIILASFITIVITKGIPTLRESTLILLGISAITTGSARITDISDQKNPGITPIQDEEGENFILDILSDSNGVSIHRFQSAIFNIAFGIWFIVKVLQNLPANSASEIMPDLLPNNLILLGLSSGAYLALKTTENKNQTAVG